MKRLNATGLFMLLLLSISCKKEVEQVQETGSDIAISMQYNSGGNLLLFDTLLFRNAAGEDYSVNRLEFYISNVVLYGSSGNVTFNDVYYLNADDARFKGFTLRNVPKGDYSGIGFLFGLDSVRNVPGGLPPNIENNAMFWPVQMGGGYHFMKFEGHFRDTGGMSGFAIHLGRNGNTVAETLPLSFAVSAQTHRMQLSMDVNEWMEDPSVYSFVQDGKYTMSSDPLMKKIAGNGKDVFTCNWMP